MSENRGKGYGSMMMNHILKEIQDSGYNSVLLWVFEKNTRARTFYEKHGFELTDNTQISYDAVEVMHRKDFDVKQTVFVQENISHCRYNGVVKVDFYT